jgi:hypothetical protein
VVTVSIVLLLLNGFGRGGGAAGVAVDAPNASPAVTGPAIARLSRRDAPDTGSSFIIATHPGFRPSFLSMRFSVIGIPNRGRNDHPNGSGGGARSGSP